jgi:hypothetical protein
MKIVPTGVPNRVKDGATGVSYARAKVGDLNKYRSLDTTKIATAKLRLPDKLKGIREDVPTEKPTRGLEATATFQDTAPSTSRTSKMTRAWSRPPFVRVGPLATLRRT